VKPEKTPNNHPNSVRAEILAWLRPLLATKHVKLPAVVTKATKHFLGDPAFLRRFAAEMLRALIQRVAYDAFYHSRGSLDIRLTKVTLPDVAHSIIERWESSKWQNHYEHAGDTYVALPELTTELGRLAIAERRVRAASEERAALFVERLIARLSPKERVLQCWTPDEVTALYNEINGDEAAA
jgi:hypothetical protein